MDLGSIFSSSSDDKPSNNVKDSFLVFDNETGTFRNVNFSKVKKDLRANINNIISKGKSWPQRTTKNRGFLTTSLIPPYKDNNDNRDFTAYKDLLLSSRYDQNSTNDEIRKVLDELSATKKYGSYEYTDWLGYKIKPGGLETVPNVNTTENKFKESTKLPKTVTELKDSPYSTRDHYLLFNDNSTNYFKHGLQIIDNLNPIENPESGKSELRLSQFQQTPFENNDPVMFGFEIIIDIESSPLLNDSILDFLKIYSGVDEIKYKIPVYEDFKQQFTKLFRTKTTAKTTRVDINEEQVSISKNKSNYANTDSGKPIFNGGKKAYMSYYLKKIGGLGNLIESNTTDKKKFLVDYRTDFITLDFNEDVSLTLGTLAHLYKLLYWSKPNGKSLVPENLLRFNCDIIVSEVRNFNRVRKSIDKGDIEVIKDNLSRYIYTLNECQLFFNTMPHNPEVDLSAIATYDNYSIQFDYKYSTVKFERFMPSGDFGKYVGYDGGAIWKIGNPGARVNRGGTQSSTTDTSLPRFFTYGNNVLSQNGVKSPLVLERFGTKLPKNPEGFSPEDKVTALETSKEGFDLEQFKKNAQAQTTTFKKLNEIISQQNLKSELVGTEVVNSVPDKNFIERLKDQTISNVKRELTTLLHGRISLLSRTANKLLIDFVGSKGVTPPQNIYKGPQDPMGIAMTNIADRFFYDIRNDLADFAGGAISDALNPKDPNGRPKLK